jgi:hypothetical protein
MNDASGAPEDLPFDLSHHRVMTYSMPEGVTDRSTERLSLQRKLEGAIRAALASFSPKLPPIPSKANSFLAEHQFMTTGQHRLAIPSNPEYSVGQVRFMIREGGSHTRPYD